MVYVIGFTTGVYTIAKGGGVEAASEFSGLERKIASGVTAGANFFQIDMEFLGEWFSPYILEKLERIIKGMNVDWGLHGEIITHYTHFDDARKTAWKLDNFRLHRYLDRFYELFILKNKLDIFPRYLLFHASMREVVGYYVYKEKPAEDLTFTPLGYKQKRYRDDYEGEEIFWENFLDPEKEFPFYAYDKETKIHLKKWFQAKVVPLLISRDIVAGRRMIEFLFPLFGSLEGKEEIAEKLSELIVNELIKRKVITEEEKEKVKQDLKSFFVGKVEKSVEIIEKYPLTFFSILGDIFLEYEEIRRELKGFYDELYERWKNEISTRYGEIGGIPYEDIVLAITCKYLELARGKEKIWDIFVGEKTIKDIIGQDVIDLEKGVILNPKLNAIAASRYVISHFESLPLRDYIDEIERYLETANLSEEEKQKLREFSKKPIFEKIAIINEELKKVGRKFYIVFENPEGKTPLEGINRISHLLDVYYLVKSLNEYGKMFLGDESFDYFRACVDTEHLVTQGFEPQVEIDSLPEDAGKYFLVYHVGMPRGAHAHEPIEIGSDAQFIIYEYCYKLREKGFGKDEDVYLIFERGAGKTAFEFMRTTILALRKIVEYLEKDVPPEKLDERFIGWHETSPEFIRQREIIRKYAFEPLKETLILPPEEHTYLGRFVIEQRKVRPEVWKKEELK